MSAPQPTLSLVATLSPESLPVCLPACLSNRELSHLQFNRRIIGQAQDASLPVAERLRFLAIAAANLDEFFEVRVAGIKAQIKAGDTTATPDGMAPSDVLRAIRDAVLPLQEEVSRCAKEVLALLRAEGIDVVPPSAWTTEQQAAMCSVMHKRLWPIVTPLVLDASHPFPRIANKSVNILAELAGEDGEPPQFAVLQVPHTVPRWLSMPGQAQSFAWGPAALQHSLGELLGRPVLRSHLFRLTRCSDLVVDSVLPRGVDLLQSIAEQLPVRHLRNAVRLEVCSDMPERWQNILTSTFHLRPDDVYHIETPVGLSALAGLYEQIDRPALKFKPTTPRGLNQPGNIFERLRQGDVVLHHPFDAFEPVVDMLRQAAADPQVLAIKQTLYRTDSQSPILAALIAAARAGKEVTAVVELRARFDEAANIEHAKTLQRAGVRVVYGVMGYKCHAKMLLIVRHESGGTLRRYVHLGTGNYNTQTARSYTDLSLLTCDPDIGEDVQALFTFITGLGKIDTLRALWHAPHNFHGQLLACIEREISEKRAGRPALIAARMNTLTDPEICTALVRACQAGVVVKLVVRGTCVLRPGVPGYTETLQVRSVVGQFLEHSRLYYFHAAGEQQVWCGSADWMQRNFFRRIEVAFPIRDPHARARLVDEALHLYLADNCQAYVMQSDGTYVRQQPRPGKKARSAQRTLLARLDASAVAAVSPDSLSDLLLAPDLPR